MSFRLSQYNVIFWDFDGVIKESMEAKTWIFRELFKDYGETVQDQVQQHHEEHGGMSRFEKIPYYFREYLRQTISEAELTQWCERFSQLSVEQVLKAAWVPGVYPYLEQFHQRQTFYVVTGTPQEEIEYLLKQLNIETYFVEVFGAPVQKDHAVRQVLGRKGYALKDCLVVGDSLTDYHAATNNGVAFLLRTTPINQPLFQNIACPRIPDFLEVQ